MYTLIRYLKNRSFLNYIFFKIYNYVILSYFYKILAITEYFTEIQISFFYFVQKSPILFKMHQLLYLFLTSTLNKKDKHYLDVISLIIF